MINETELEKAADSYAENTELNYPDELSEAFKSGATWQAERSEERIKEIVEAAEVFKGIQIDERNELKKQITALESALKMAEDHLIMISKHKKYDLIDDCEYSTPEAIVAKEALSQIRSITSPSSDEGENNGN